MEQIRLGRLARYVSRELMYDTGMKESNHEWLYEESVDVRSVHSFYLTSYGVTNFLLI